MLETELCYLLQLLSARDRILRNEVRDLADLFCCLRCWLRLCLGYSFMLAFKKAICAGQRFTLSKCLRQEVLIRSDVIVLFVLESIICSVPEGTVCHPGRL